MADVTDLDYEDVRSWLLGLDWPGSAREWPVLGEPLHSFGTKLADLHGLNPPRAAIAHRDCAVGWHTDRRNPYPCVNILIVFRDGCAGGRLEFRNGSGIEPGDRERCVFDGQAEHRITDIVLTGPYAYRIGLTFYCPL